MRTPHECVAELLRNTDDANTRGLQMLHALAAGGSKIVAINRPPAASSLAQPRGVPSIPLRSKLPQQAESVVCEAPNDKWCIDVQISLMASRLCQSAVEKVLDAAAAQLERCHRKREALLEEGRLVELDDTSHKCTSSPMEEAPSPCADGGVSSLIAPSKYYTMQCARLGARAQRAVVEAFQRLERDIASFHGGVPPLPSFLVPAQEAAVEGQGVWAPVLDASSCVLGPRGFVGVVDTVRYYGQCCVWLGVDNAVCMKGISLAGCGLTDRCLECLLLTLQQYRLSDRVVWLDLSDNPKIGVDGGNALRDYLASPITSLERVVLSGTSIRSSTARSIQTLLERRAQVHSLPPSRDTSRHDKFL